MTIYSLNNFEQIPGPAYIKHSVPFNEEAPNLKMVGTMALSRGGYLYSPHSRITAWAKFLGLALYLPLRGVVSSICQLAKKIFGCHISEKGYHDLGHTLKLSGIAFKAVVGWNGASLLDRIEEFSLAEIDYNNQDRLQELEKPRSERFAKGFYIARCMNPVFHQSQYNSPNKKLSAQCHRYADHMIRMQHANGYVQTTELECCDIVCYREQRVCGCISKVECCALQFFTLNCGLMQCCCGNSFCCIAC